MTRESFNKKNNLKEIILADSGSYLSLKGNSNLGKHPLDQKLLLLQRESMSRGSITKPPGTSGGRESLHFGVDELYQKHKYLPKLRGIKLESDRDEYSTSLRKDDNLDEPKGEKHSQPNQAVSRGSRRNKKKQFAIFPEGFNPHEELIG